MKQFPSQILPTYSDEVLQDTLFHYTTASGLLGILKENSIWSTAHYCTNDETELEHAKGVLTPLFRNKTYDLIRDQNNRVDVFNKRGVNIMDYADQFENNIFGHTLHFLNVYITSFCKPSDKQDFWHGALSQWRGYGEDGGYALQFSRERLDAAIKRLKKESDLSYELQDVYYSKKSNLKDEVESHSDAFINSYVDHLDMLMDPFDKKKVKRPISGLTGGPLESLLDYIICTKNEHFREENECRMSLLDLASSKTRTLFLDHFNRNGLIIPYTKTPPEFNILECVDWIIVGPSPRIESRLNSVRHMVNNLGLKIKVRASHIPFSRH